MAALNNFMPDVLRLLTERKRAEAIKLLSENWNGLNSAEQVQAKKSFRQVATLNDLAELKLEELKLDGLKA